MTNYSIDDADGTNNATTPVLIRTWKVRTTARGVVLTINGVEYDLGATAHALAFEVARAADGWNAPETLVLVDDT